MKYYLVADKDGSKWIWRERPIRGIDEWEHLFEQVFGYTPPDSFIELTEWCDRSGHDSVKDWEVTWEDEPIEINSYFEDYLL